MEQSKSRYEVMLEGVIAKSRKVSFTDEQNFRIIEELNEGMEDFLYEQKKTKKESERELTSIELNA